MQGGRTGGVAHLRYALRPDSLRGIRRPGLRVERQIDMLGTSCITHNEIDIHA